MPTSAPCQKGVYKTNFKTFPNAKKFYTELSSVTLQINYAEMLYATTSTFTLAREWKVRVEGGTCVNNTGETTCRGGLVVLCANLHLFFFCYPTDQHFFFLVRSTVNRSAQLGPRDGTSTTLNTPRRCPHTQSTFPSPHPTRRPYCMWKWKGEKKEGFGSEEGWGGGSTIVFTTRSCHSYISIATYRDAREHDQ